MTFPELIPNLPAVNASLNAVAAALLLLGRIAIKSGDTARHRRLMLAAFTVSALFLASYLTYHYAKPEPTRYVGAPVMRALYLLVLIPHVVLATLNLPFILAALLAALQGRFDAHRRLVRRVWPVWMYVSVTGVLVYLMLYVLPKGAP
ncbi:MAG: DUF420 domain-containing protein [Kiritimatiellia bacterium]